jgi:hypothetical protein
VVFTPPHGFRFAGVRFPVLLFQCIEGGSPMKQGGTLCVACRDIASVLPQEAWSEHFQRDAPWVQQLARTARRWGEDEETVTWALGVCGLIVSRAERC